MDIIQNALAFGTAKSVSILGSGFEASGSDIIQRMISGDYKDITQIIDIVLNSLKDALAKIDKDLEEKRMAWHKNLSKDIYISEALNVLSQLKIGVKQENVKKEIILVDDGSVDGTNKLISKGIDVSLFATLLKINPTPNNNNSIIMVTKVISKKVPIPFTNVNSINK